MRRRKISGLVKGIKVEALKKKEIIVATNRKGHKLKNKRKETERKTITREGKKKEEVDVLVRLN